MRNEKHQTRGERGTRKEVSSVVPASGRPSSIGFKYGHPWSLTVLLSLLLMMLPSCGYRLTPRGGVVPEGARTIAVAAFVNNTKEPYVDVEVTKAVVDEFLADGRLKVVGSESADLVLRGTVTKFDVIAQSYTAEAYVQQYMVSIAVSASIEDARSHTIIWQEGGISSVFVASYPVTIGDITATKIAKETALRKASQDVAWTLRSRVLEGF